MDGQECLGITQVYKCLIGYASAIVLRNREVRVLAQRLHCRVARDAGQAGLHFTHGLPGEAARVVGCASAMERAHPGQGCDHGNCDLGFGDLGGGEFLELSVEE